MGKRPTSRSEQQKGKKQKQKPKLAASEVAVAIKRQDAAVALAARPPEAPEAPAPEMPTRQTSAPETLVPRTPAPEARPYALENAVDTIQRLLTAAGLGSVAVNRKLMDFARANLSSSLDLATSLAAARSPMQVVHLQVTYWDERMRALASQAEELRALSADIVAKANEPIREHMRRRQASG